MINQNKKNNIITYVGIGLLAVAAGFSWNLAKKNITPTTVVNNLETKLEQSAKLNYVETERNGEPYVFYQNTLYKVTTMNVLPSRGIDDAVQRAGIKYNAEERYLNSQYNKDHGKGGILQPGDEVYVLEKAADF
ncbi:hypothetical protein FP803_02035 [Candidatus Woesearchaeota archaeon]|nr:hypothetical protein [Candidatus Woesearchaeota archaeon]MBU3941285.1 hypothetical protein [Nanoarchaeota archaeon]